MSVFLSDRQLLKDQQLVVEVVSSDMRWKTIIALNQTSQRLRSAILPFLYNYFTVQGFSSLMYFLDRITPQVYNTIQTLDIGCLVDHVDRFEDEAKDILKGMKERLSGVKNSREEELTVIFRNLCAHEGLFPYAQLLDNLSATTVSFEFGDCPSVHVVDHIKAMYPSSVSCWILNLPFDLGSDIKPFAAENCCLNAIYTALQDLDPDGKRLELHIEGYFPDLWDMNMDVDQLKVKNKMMKDSVLPLIKLVEGGWFSEVDIYPPEGNKHAFCTKGGESLLEGVSLVVCGRVDGCEKHRYSTDIIVDNFFCDINYDLTMEELTELEGRE